MVLEESRKKCPNCDKNYKKYNGTYSITLICEECLEIKRIYKEHDEWCQNPQVHTVKMKQSV